jgi:glycosidase
MDHLDAELVINHTSNEHPWFQLAQSGDVGPRIGGRLYGLRGHT